MSAKLSGAWDLQRYLGNASWVKFLRLCKFFCIAIATKTREIIFIRAFVFAHIRQIEPNQIYILLVDGGRSKGWKYVPGKSGKIQTPQKRDADFEKLLCDCGYGVADFCTIGSRELF